MKLKITNLLGGHSSILQSTEAMPALLQQGAITDEEAQSILGGNLVINGGYKYELVCEKGGVLPKIGCIIYRDLKIEDGDEFLSLVGKINKLSESKVDMYIEGCTITFKKEEVK